MNSQLLRRWHNYLGAFIAPSILFFAFTGALQLFSLHEAHDGYQPAPVIEKLAQLAQESGVRTEASRAAAGQGGRHPRRAVPQFRMTTSRQSGPTC